MVSRRPWTFPSARRRTDGVAPVELRADSPGAPVLPPTQQPKPAPVPARMPVSAGLCTREARSAGLGDRNFATSESPEKYRASSVLARVLRIHAPPTWFPNRSRLCFFYFLYFKGFRYWLKIEHRLKYYAAILFLIIMHRTALI